MVVSFSGRRQFRFLRTEVEIFPHDELGARRAHAQLGQVGRRDAERVHIGRQVPASLSRARHHVITLAQHTHDPETVLAVTRSLSHFNTTAQTDKLNPIDPKSADLQVRYAS